MSTSNRRIVLARRPQGMVTPDLFRMETVPMPSVGAGQVLVRTHYFSVDPYMRGRMEETKSYAEPQKLDEVMLGASVGVVVESRHAGFAPGDAVIGGLGWQEYGVSDGAMLRKIDTRGISMSAYLGVVGMPGVTAWYGLKKICEPKPGETVLVSAASGAVGSVVGQLAKAMGCRTIGIAGGATKCEHVVKDLGFDACVDHREHIDLRSMTAALKAVAPKGIDCVFENVGGHGLDAALALSNPFGRVALCGLIAGYNGQSIPLVNVRALLVMRVKLQGFIIADHLDVWPAALDELGQGVAAGRIKYRESVAQGLESAPEAFIGMLQGRNFGKQVVRLV